jgi:putative flippase GtrA
MRVTLLYALFAAISTVVNIGSQVVVHRLVGWAFETVIALAVGTGAGLVVKYVLDKKFIFGYSTRSFTHDLKLLALYATMSLVTTGIFWSFEFGFIAIFRSEFMGYVGGALGLTIGYVAKYHLDRRFVFRADGDSSPGVPLST